MFKLSMSLLNDGNFISISVFPGLSDFCELEFWESEKLLVKSGNYLDLANFSRVSVKDRETKVEIFWRFAFGQDS